ncbi:serine hydrolase domain-containing protein [Deinococcus sp. MIMF12]|uniref:Serine hydrolase domain-containing protein n=1 Tax=Deinococcus rhizophilus TaxID=3049544 RepID=A0ABT7JDP8_9DEIO|nr:serine hydrolase domain-containing protein [Deinococcus rhizophilus]MDL2343183.1 serine hydrolase domain-containing protein [Deinococcus rhizophilus]
MPTAQLDALVDEARATHSSALVVMQGGEVLVDEVLDGRGDRPIETMSVTKAVLSLVVGRAVTLGHLPGADVPVCEFFPEWRQGRKRDVMLRHLMTHTSGLQNVPMAPAEIYPSPDFVQLALCAELEHAPGSVFAYNNKAVNLICGLLERATGQKADDFARAELFGPLGIEEWEWVRDPAGNPHGLAGLRLHARDLARLGQVALDGGNGLITREWLEESTRPATPAEPSIGLLWWMLPAWTRYSIGEGQIESLRRVGGTAEQVAALEDCRCQGVERDRVLHLIRQVDLRPQEFPRDAQWLGSEQGPNVGFRHDGYRGQNLAVHREARLVAVRLIAWDHPQVEAPQSAFPTFPDRILTLAPA